MRRFLLLLTLISGAAFAQAPAASQFVLRIQPVRADFTLQNMTADEARIATQHAQYLKSLLDSGKLRMAGQALDPKGLWGVIIVDAPDKQSAEALLNADPSIQGKLFRGEVVPFRTVFERPAAK
jgi:uncharacterized protein